MKSHNIQLGGWPPVISCQSLVVYSGPWGDNTDEAIYESNDVVEEKKADVKTEVNPMVHLMNPQVCTLQGVWCLHLIHTNAHKLQEVVV